MGKLANRIRKTEGPAFCKFLLQGGKLFFFGLAVYLAGILTFSFVEYHHIRSSLLDDIDHQLLTTISYAEPVLHETLGENVLGHQEIGREVAYRLALKLQSLADTMQVDYIYSIIAVPLT